MHQCPTAFRLADGRQRTRASRDCIGELAAAAAALCSLAGRLRCGGRHDCLGAETRVLLAPTSKQRDGKHRRMLVDHHHKCSDGLGAAASRPACC